MKTALELIPAAETFTGKIIGDVTLDFDSRRRRRIRLETDQGTAFLLNLSEVKTLRDCDVLRMEDGSGIRVKAAPEPVVDVTCQSTAELVRVAWHLGNRHLPTQLMGDRLRIRQDHVIEDMLTKLGAKPERLQAPFNPEGGAYGHGETMGHDHSSGSGAAHGHEHSHDHSH